MTHFYSRILCHVTRSQSAAQHGSWQNMRTDHGLAYCRIRERRLATKFRQGRVFAVSTLESVAPRMRPTHIVLSRRVCCVSQASGLQAANGQCASFLDGKRWSQTFMHSQLCRLSTTADTWVGVSTFYAERNRAIPSQS